MEDNSNSENEDFSSCVSNDDPSKILQCRLCPETFTHASTLRRHMKNHLAGNCSPIKINEEFDCNLCGLQFYYVYRYTSHMKKYHSGRQPSKSLEDTSHFMKALHCVFCQRGFASEDALNNHSCNYNKKEQAPTKSPLKMGNLNQSHYDCDYCDRRFRYKVSMVKHLKMHLVKLYGPNEGDENFSSEASLMRPKKVGLNDKVLRLKKKKKKKKKKKMQNKKKKRIVNQNVFAKNNSRSIGCKEVSIRIERVESANQKRPKVQLADESKQIDVRTPVNDDGVSSGDSANVKGSLLWNTDGGAYISDTTTCRAVPVTSKENVELALERLFAEGSTASPKVQVQQVKTNTETQFQADKPSVWRKAERGVVDKSVNVGERGQKLKKGIHAAETASSIGSAAPAPKDIRSSSSNDRTQSDEDEVSTTKGVACPLCNRKFYTEQTMQLHKRTHEKRPSSQMYYCSLCDFGIADQFEFAVHVLNHSTKRFKCVLCGRSFHTEATLKMHAQTHGTSCGCDKGLEKEKYSNVLQRCQQNVCFIKNKNCDPLNQYLCHYCGKKYFSKMMLNLHLENSCQGFVSSNTASSSKLHFEPKLGLKLKLFICQYCKKGFSQAASYKFHLTSHQSGDTLAEAEFTQNMKIEAHRPTSRRGRSQNFSKKITRNTVSNESELTDWLTRGQISNEIPAKGSTRSTKVVARKEVSNKSEIKKFKNLEEVLSKEGVPCMSPEGARFSNEEVIPNLRGLATKLKKFVAKKKTTRHVPFRKLLESNEEIAKYDKMNLPEPMMVENISSIEGSDTTDEILNGGVYTDDKVLLKEMICIEEMRKRVEEDYRKQQEQLICEEVTSTNEIVFTEIPETVNDEVVHKSQRRTDNNMPCSNLESSNELPRSFSKVKQSNNKPQGSSSNVKSLEKTRNCLLISKPFVCTICNRKFRTKSTLRFHCSNTHQKVISEGAKSCSYEKVTSCYSVHGNGDTRCCVSKNRSQNTSTFRKFEETSPVFTCTLCKFSSTNQNSFAQHVLFHHRKKYSCSFCSRTFFTRNTMILHSRMHTGAVLIN